MAGNRARVIFRQVSYDSLKVEGEFKAKLDFFVVVLLAFKTKNSCDLSRFSARECSRSGPDILYYSVVEFDSFLFI